MYFLHLQEESRERQVEVTLPGEQKYTTFYRAAWNADVV